MSKYGNYKFITVIAILVVSIMISPTMAQDDPEFVVTYALPYDFREYSQFTSQSYATAAWLSIVSAGLYSRSAENDRNYIPELAEKLPVSSADGLTHVVVLKNNLIFSDGTPLTAEDVVFTYHSLLNPDINFNTYATYSAFFTKDSIIAIDDHTIEFTLKERLSGFMTLLSASIQPLAHFQERLDNDDFDWNANDLSDAISAGPFKVESFDDENMKIVMVRNPNYWNEENVVSNVIVVKKIGEKAAAISAMEDGEIQILDGQYVVGIDEMNGINGTTEHFIATPSHQEFSLNHIHPYFGTGENLTVDDKVEGAKAIRKAISHIIDREYIVTNVMEGLAYPLATIVPPAIIGWNPDLEYREYSITKAKELMTQAGLNFDDLGTPDDEGNYPDFFFEISMLTPNSCCNTNFWHYVLIQNLPKIGIGVKEHLSTGWDTIIPRTFGSDTPPPLFDDGGFDVFALGYRWDLHFDPYGLYESYSLRPVGGNYHNFENEEYDLLSEELAGELDVDKRMVLMHEIQDFYYEWEIVVPIISPAEHWAFSADLLGYDAVLLSTTQGGWDKIGTQEAIDAREPFWSSIDFDLFSLIIPFMILSIISYSLKKRHPINKI